MIFVLLCSNMIISAVRKTIPPLVRIPVFIVIIATFVTILSLVFEAYLPPLHESLGIYLSLIVVNCIILGRAEVFASKNNVLFSIADAIGIGLGFTIALIIISTLREILGTGGLAVFGFELFKIPVLSEHPTDFLYIASGGIFGHRASDGPVQMDRSDKK